MKETIEDYQPILKMLTDYQLAKIYGRGTDADHGPFLTSHNGFECRRVLHGIPSAGVCGGTAIIVNVKLTLRDTCNEPCSWICESTRRLRESIEHVQLMDKIICESRREK